MSLSNVDTDARIYAVIPAAGSGNRMGDLSSARAKVLLHLDGCGSILDLTLSALSASGVFSGAVVAARAEDLAEVTQLARDRLSGLDVIGVVGGTTRQESVYRGLMAVNGRATHVLVHDGARPFCPPERIRVVAQAVLDTGAAILAVKAKNTLKLARESAIKQTVPRCDIWEAQTPQAFALELLISAHEKAREDGYTGTDDSELVERLGRTVTIVEGSDANIKITTPHDLELAKLILLTQHS